VGSDDASAGLVASGGTISHFARAVTADGPILLAPAGLDDGTWLRACFVNHPMTDEDVYVIPEVAGEVSEAMAEREELRP
jgi:hypothetical protein